MLSSAICLSLLMQAAADLPAQSPATATAPVPASGPAIPEPSPIPAPSPTPAPPPPPVVPAPPPPDASGPLFFASLDRGLGVSTADSSFSAELHFFAQIRLDEVIADTVRVPEFRVAMARPVLRGKLLRPWIQYFIQPELAGRSATLLDAEITIQPHPAIGVRVGQFLTPFSREFLVPPFRLLFPDFAPSNVFFRDNRDLGAMVFGMPADGHLEYYAGVFNGNGINQVPGGGRIMAIARLAANLRGKPVYSETPQFDDTQPQVSIGINGTYGRHDLPLDAGGPPTVPAEVAPYATVGLDLALSRGACVLQTEGYARWQQLSGGATVWAAGGYLHGGCFVYRRYLQLAARGDVIDANVVTSAVIKSQAEALFVYYVRGNHLKLLLRYAYGNTRSRDDNVPAAASHGLTLQGQLQL